MWAKGFVAASAFRLALGGLTEPGARLKPQPRVIAIHAHGLDPGARTSARHHSRHRANQGRLSVARHRRGPGAVRWLRLRGLQQRERRASEQQRRRRCGRPRTAACGSARRAALRSTGTASSPPTPRKTAWAIRPSIPSRKTGPARIWVVAGVYLSRFQDGKFTNYSPRQGLAHRSHALGLFGRDGSSMWPDSGEWRGSTGGRFVSRDRPSEMHATWSARSLQDRAGIFGWRAASGC